MLLEKGLPDAAMDADFQSIADIHNGNSRKRAHDLAFS